MGNILSEPKLEKESKKTIIYYSDEEQYIGECNGEVREGTGVYTYANGDKYEGQWLNNVKQGKGYFYYNNGELYIGDWMKNKKCGKGMYFYQTGDRFDGEWEDNMKQGEGTYYYVDGTIYHGHFKNSKKHGVGTMKTPEGFVYEEVWEEGQLLTRKIIQKPEPGPDSKAKKITRQKSVTVVKNFAKKPRKPRVTENGLTFMSHLDVSQYVNEKLLHKNINEWKTKDVCDWLDRGGFSQYKDNFSSNHITGRNLFDLTENDLKDDFNITNAVHRKRIMQDLELLKKIYSKNSDDNQYIRNKLLRFYEKNQGELFTKKNAAASSRTSINLGGVMVAPGEIGDEMTIRDKELKDVKDKQDTLEDVSLEQKMASSSTSSSSSESSSNEEQNEATEKEAPGKKIKNQANKGPESEQEEEKPQLHMSEYRTILDNYQKNDFNLLETIKKTLGKMSVIDYSELEMAQSIGEGGYGEVFKGKWLGQDVAIKVYGRKKVRNKEKIDQDFLREVEVVSRLRHPNIVLFMGVSLTPQGKGFLITEYNYRINQLAKPWTRYLEGGSLFDHLHKKGTKFDETTIINIALDIALGMNYLHGQKILHCDLKSSNILLDEHFNVKLADFGLSKSKRKIHGRKHFKRVGTPHWMAPEIMREEEYDEASDVYSYGMIIWELMVKKVPYFGLKVNQIVGSVGYGDKQVPIPETGNEIMITLMKQCLCKTRSGRPTFREITEYLKDTDRHRKLIAMRELDSFFN